jgi:hypothetical protein
VTSRDPCPVCGSAGYCVLAGERGAPMHPRPKTMVLPSVRVPTEAEVMAFFDQLADAVMPWIERELLASRTPRD